MSLIWVAAVGLFASMTICNYATAKKKTSRSKASTLRSFVKTAMLQNLWCKEDFLTLNGGWVRALGQRECNGIYRLENGHLSDLTDLSLNVSNVTNTMRLADFCGRKGVEFVFLMCPCKIDVNNEILPAGMPVDARNAIANEFLSKAKCRTFDLRPIVAGTKEEVTANFFKTDHHWNFTGAFKAFPAVAHELLNMLEADEAVPQLRNKSWRTSNLGRSFLGSRGRRTGPLFGGMDDNVAYYLPKFATDCLLSVPARRIFRCGAFSESFIYPEYIRPPVSVYKDLGYGVYGGDYPLVRMTNSKAAVRKRILVVKDSYAPPLLAYLSSVFAELDIVDVRYSKDVSAIEFINCFKPDLVCVMYNPGALAMTSMFKFGLPETARLSCADKESARSVNIPVRENRYNYVVAHAGLKPGSLVKVAVESVDVVAGLCDMATVAVYDTNAKKIVKWEILRTGAERPQVLVMSVPQTPGNYNLLFYAGEHGATEGNAIRFNGVVVQEFEALKNKKENAK